MHYFNFVHFLAIEAEKGQQKFIAGIENFDTKKLKHTETLEKNSLPTKEGKCKLNCYTRMSLKYNTVHIH